LRGRQEEEINGEGNREVLRDLEGEEGGAKGVVRGDGDAPEPRGRAFGSTAVKKAGSARGRGIRSVKEGKEGERRHHCRSCSLSVWVASGVEAIQIIDEGGRIMGVVKVAIAGGPKGHGGGAESAIVKVGVKLGKMRVDREEIFVWIEANVPIGNHEAIESLKDMVLVGAASRFPMGETAASEGYDPCPHVMPYGCKASVVSSIVVRRGGVKRVEVNMGQRAMSAEAER
jgi:hypothetical protein